ncbi:MAG TPA: peptide-methionine (S)-S-oxide reductase MsrA [Thermodesulfobacteriota bacterium]|nr:peptide-methionine (S)-S-oxide reductase MsrA [Thermodesulfobacteriota bacterium]
MNKFSLIFTALLVISLSGALRAEENGGTAKAQDAKYETATFAGGCFWCIQPPFDKLEGVVSTTVGYTGGMEKDPTYEQVSYGKTGHTESIEIIYDPKKVTYEELLEVFWININPTDNGGQFVDRGKQYRPGIFYHGEAQKKAAEASKDKLDKSGRFDKPVVVEIVEATEFYRAEDYHQKFYQKSPVRYKSYRWGSGRDQFIEKYWGEAALSH